MNKIVFTSVGLGYCKGCKFKEELDKEDNCPHCWHIKLKDNYPFICKSNGQWAAYINRDEMPTAPGCW